MAGLEIAGMALACADAVIQLLAAIKFRQDLHKKIPTLIESTERRVLRIRKMIETYGALGERANLPGDVFMRVVEDFDSIKAELVVVQKKIASGPKFKNWLSSPAFFDSLSTTLSRLSPLEMHLDLYGLMSYRENTIASCFSDLSSSIQRVSDDVNLDLQRNLNTMMCKIEAISGRLGLGTQEALNIGRSATSTDTSVHTVDEMETRSLSEFSSLSSQSRELLEMLASSGISSDEKEDLGEKIRHIWSGWRVCIEDIEFETTKGGFRKRLGEGGFSTVCKGLLIRRSSNGEREGEALLVAFKHLKIEEHELPGRRADFLRELFLQLDIDHPCVLKTYGGFWPEIEGGDKVTDSAKGVLDDDDDDDYTPPYIVTERMTCNVAKAVRGNLLRDAATQKRVIIDVAEGLAHLHGRGVVHRDIKPENILLRLKKNGELIGNAKICDFGISRRVRNAQYDTMCSTTGGPCGTIAYMPPEVLCNFRNYPSRKSWDVWSFGVLICYIVVAECRTELGKLRPFKAESIAKNGELAIIMHVLASKVPDPVLREVATMCLFGKEIDRLEMHRVVHMLRGTGTANVSVNVSVNVGIRESDGKRNEKQDFSFGQFVEQLLETKNDDEKHVEQRFNKPREALALVETFKKTNRKSATWKQVLSKKRHFRPWNPFVSNTQTADVSLFPRQPASDVPAVRKLTIGLNETYEAINNAYYAKKRREGRAAEHDPPADCDPPVNDRSVHADDPAAAAAAVAADAADARHASDETAIASALAVAAVADHADAQARVVADGGDSGGGGGGKGDGGGHSPTSSLSLRYCDENHDYIVRTGDMLSNRYRLEKVISRGSSGQIVRAYDTRENSHVAIKVFKNSARYVEQTLSEVRMTSYLNRIGPADAHAIVRFHDKFIFRGHQCLVLELLSFSLYDLLRSTEFFGVSLSLVRKFCRQILTCLAFLARPDVNIAHCDLRPKNVLLVHGQRSRVRVTDFGASCRVSESMFTQVQSLLYRAPEVILGLPYDTQVDIWSLGCMLVELHVGCPVFAGRDEGDQISIIVERMGMPPKHMLDTGRKTVLFFDKDPDTGEWTLKDDISHNEERIEPGSKPIQAFVDGAARGKRETDVDYDAFLTLVSGMLEFDPHMRISADKALRSSYITRRSGRDSPP